MKIRPEIKISGEEGITHKKISYAGIKVTMTFEEVGKLFQRVKNIFKKVNKDK